uniref:CRAL-TRIO domain-containing protein n=1 Tax=Opuntia streptacantha TaxID=393608 RepID=A0A7C9F419_OPUST
METVQQAQENGGQGMIKDEENNSTAEEQHKLSLMRALVERRDPASKEVDDSTLRRFLRARDLDVEKAAAFFLKYLKWRTTFVPNGHISDAEVQNEIAQNKMFIGGADKKGRPILVVFGCRHFQNPDPDEFKRVVVYCLDKICSRMPAGQEKFVSIGDLQGWGFSNSDIRGYLAALSILQIVFVDDSKLKSTLLEDIDESQLPDTYGGKLPLVPLQEA